MLNKRPTYIKGQDLPENINPNLPPDDFFYHLDFDRHGNGLTGPFKGMNLMEAFGDVTHICMGGSPERAERFAQTLHKEKYPDSMSSVKAIGKTERFSMYKVGSVISVSHGMGMPSMSILLNEVAKMLYYAKGCNEDKLRNEVSFIRIGTSGGIGVEGGTVVVAENGVNPKGKKEHTETKLGSDFIYPTVLDKKLSGEILAANITEEVGKEIKAVMGDTVGTHDFYEGQGRVDGFFDPGYTENDKIAYLDYLGQQGVKNFEMESTCFAATCLRLGIPGAIVCVALLNRLKGDQVHIPEGIGENAEKIVLNYLRRVQAI